ncbi:MAG: hypothetical protein PHX87_02060 [Candidatus Peribacteraceae bacterium]|nr:hypothetical protein [Candidatus Peribacteraceae bacterium]MDD5742192.1 hypothetical protein [Candidatus Peribacteraceae bacterium]
MSQQSLNAPEERSAPIPKGRQKTWPVIQQMLTATLEAKRKRLLGKGQTVSAAMIATGD